MTSKLNQGTDGFEPGVDEAGDENRIEVRRVPVSKADLHCHSTASAEAGLAIQKTLGLPECATPPEAVYELAKERGMDFVTITDHDTIDGVLQIADRPDVFISEELTARFAGEPQAVHILCYDITPDDHYALQERAGDLESVVDYLGENEIVAALAHPFFAVAAPLEPRHRRRLAELFDIWEIRNGSRARELNLPAFVYTETRGGVGIAGSDDHAGVDIGRTWSETPRVATPQEFLAHLSNGRVEARGQQGSAAKWAHSALALATRVLADEDGGPTASPRPDQVMALALRVVGDGAARGGGGETDLGPDDAGALLRAWTDGMGIDDLIGTMQADGFGHGSLFRKARHLHERRLRESTTALVEALAAGEGFLEAGIGLFDACLPVVPYAPAVSILARERSRLTPADSGHGRVAVIVEGAGSMHGVTHVIERLREHGVEGYEVDIIGTDSRVDRRLPSVIDIEIPFYEGLGIGVPSLLDMTEVIADGNYDMVHITSPGPAGVIATLAARIVDTPIIASYHTDLAGYAALRSGSADVEAGMQMLLATLYGQCEMVLSPSPSADSALGGLGVDPEKILRWGRGVDASLYSPSRRKADAYPGEVKVLYAGRLSKEKGIELLADSFLAAHARDPRLHLLLAGGGPEEQWLRDRFERAAEQSGSGPIVTFLGWLDREQLADAYASADIFLFCSQTDTYGQVIAEAQASGLAVVAVNEGGPGSLIQDRRTGWLCAPDVNELASAVGQLAASPFMRHRIADRALEALGDRSWENALSQLGRGWDLALRSSLRRREMTAEVALIPEARVA